MAYLTAAEKGHFKEHGYVVIRRVLGQKVIDDALDVLWTNIEEDRNEPDSWIGKGYRVVRIGEEEAMRRIVYTDLVFAMAEEIVGKETLKTNAISILRLDTCRDFMV